MALVLSIGECRSVVQFQRSQPIDNESGGQDDAWTIVVTTRGRLRKKSGRKDIELGSLQFDKSYELVCRYQSDIPTNPDVRVIIDGKTYRINDWQTENEINDFYIFSLSRTDE